MLRQAPIVSSHLAPQLEASGFCLVPGVQMFDWLPCPPRSWSTFAASWDNLDRDRFMGDGGRYRYRRHASYTLRAGGALTRNRPRPHRQSTKFNQLNGGIERWFSPIVPSIADGPVMQAFLSICTSAFPLHPAETWLIEAHQFRIIAARDPGKPTPEGLHRDGVDYVFISLIERHNISGGVTRVVPANTAARSHTVELARPANSLFLIDTRVMHGVSPVRAAVDGDPGHRDALVLTFSKSNSPHET